MSLLDDLAVTPPADRLRVVLRIVNRVYDEPQKLLGEISPADALSAVAVVAASLPGADALPWVDDRLRRAALPGPLPVETPMMALLALDVIVGRDPASVHAFIDVNDGDAATALLHELRHVLDAGIRDLAGLDR